MKPLSISTFGWRRLRTLTIGVLIVLIAGLLLTQAVLAGGGGGLVVTRYVIGGGGGHAQSGVYTLDATSGQPIVGITQAVPSGAYDICAGFWCESSIYKVYLPILLRN